ncbi:helix-turn-helix domain-containing protein [Ruoffia tabacinasalis]|uniref:Helix-turn-helix domain-containing protein n=1 Tax=Ruoffia tabacinasalis TaxID=87458 RepID=A0ABS0LLH5_9LACT|nr:helix-turn-helix domain-containing protein [Ruoffia tabacinasalis]MBG9978979.1 helix-turn-helix domain-containing protein [Ruoffia tabacinasalis]
MNHTQLNNVELQIVQFLFEHKKQFVPSKEIAQKADVSNKTIRNHLVIE